MNFKIEWLLDESEKATANSLLGDIRLSDEMHSIVEHSVYLDSWFEALLKAAQLRIDPETDVEIAIAEQPRPLRFWRNSATRLHVMSHGKEIVIDSQDTFRNATQSAAQSFLNRAEALDDAPRNEVLKSIRKLLEQKPMTDGT